MQNGHLPGGSRDGEAQPDRLGGGPASTLLTGLPSLPAPAPPNSEGLPLPSPALPPLPLRGVKMTLLALPADRAGPLRGGSGKLCSASWGSPDWMSGHQPTGRGAEKVQGLSKPLLPSVLPAPFPSQPSPLPARHSRGLNHDRPSRWEQHKESTFHAPHQAHAERLRVLKNSL